MATSFRTTTKRIQHHRAERCQPVRSVACSFDQAQLKQQTYFTAQSPGGQAAAPHGLTITGALQKFELIRGEWGHGDSVAPVRRDVRRRLTAFWALPR